MKFLCLDFIRRWWWLILAFVMLAVLTTATKNPIIFSPLALIALSYDAQRGLLLAARPLPVSRRRQALTWWFIGVLLLPLVALVILPLGVAAEISPLKNPGQAWFAAGAAWWLGLGYGAFIFLLFVAQPTRLPVTAWDRFSGILLGLGWGLAIPGGMGLLMFAPRAYADMHGSHRVMFALVPIVFFLSLVAAPDMVKRRLQMPAAGATLMIPDGNEKTSSHGLTGLALLMAKMHGMSIAMYLFVVMAPWLMMAYVFPFFYRLPSGTTHSPELNTQAPMFAVLICSMLPDWFNLRGLRTLPLSTTSLTTLLFSVPAVLGILTAMLAAMTDSTAGFQAPLPLSCIIQAFVITGVGGLALATTVVINSGWRIFFILAFTGVIITASSLTTHHPLWTLALALTAVIASPIWLSQNLKRSSKTYRLRVMFGMQTGQNVPIR